MPTKLNSITVALIQETFALDPKENLEKIIARIHEAKKCGAELILLSELHASRYFCQVEDARYFALAETLDGTTITQLRALAKTLQLVIVSSIFERRTAGLYHNTAVVLDCDGSIAGLYRKMHIPDDPGYYEKYYFTPGDLNFAPIQTSKGRLGILVCWDQWFPEAARLMALHGAELLLYPTAIGFEPSDNSPEQGRQLDAWITIQRAHAIANGLPVLSCNRTGFEEHPQQNTASSQTTNIQHGIQFWGNSFIAGPQGELLNQANTQPTILIHTLDLTHTTTVRNAWPFLRDRRIDAYNDLNLRYGKTEF